MTSDAPDSRINPAIFVKPPFSHDALFGFIVVIGPVSYRKAVQDYDLAPGYAHAMGKSAALKALSKFELIGVCEPDADRHRVHKVLAGIRWLSQREQLENHPFAAV